MARNPAHLLPYRTVEIAVHTALHPQARASGATDARAHARDKHSDLTVRRPLRSHSSISIACGSRTSRRALW
eukprot:2448765-Pleurochrysis_carterae.AAC.2